MNAEIFAALAQLEKERGIPQAYMVEKITQALVAAYKKDKDGYTDNVFVDVQDNKMKMFVQKEVVDVSTPRKSCWMPHRIMPLTTTALITRARISAVWKVICSRIPMSSMWEKRHPAH